MRLLLVSFAAVTLLGPARAESTSLQTNSPFAAAGSGPTASTESQALATIEFTGVFVLGNKPSFSLRDTATNRSFWIDLGQTVEGVTATAYDAESHSVTITGRGGVRTLGLKEARIVNAPVPPAVATSSAPASAAVPATPAVPPRQLTIAEQLPPNLTPQQRQQRTQEIEARMMVSDLLEIGQQERARYQEEQRRRTAAPATPTPAPQGPATTN